MGQTGLLYDDSSGVTVARLAPGEKGRKMNEAASISRKVFLGRVGALAGATSVSSLLSHGEAGAGQATNERLNLRDFGAVGDGVADSGPALQRSLDALGAAGGGELVIPPGRFVIATPVSKDFHPLASSIRIVGLGSGSQVVIKAPASALAITLGNLQHLVIQGVTFVGTPGVRSDAGSVIALAYCSAAVLRDCSFYGLSSFDGPVPSIVHAANSNLTLTSCAFRGCTAGQAVVINDSWQAFLVENSLFIDHGDLGPTYVSKTNNGGGAWVQARSAARPLDNALAQNTFTVRNTAMDEGTVRAVHISPASGRVARVHLEDVNVNAHVNGVAFDIHNTDSLTIDRCYVGYASIGDVVDAVRLTDVREALVSRSFFLQLANRITADAASRVLEIHESYYSALDSAARLTVVTKEGETTRKAGGGAPATTTTTTATTTAPTAPTTTTAPPTQPPTSGTPFVTSFRPSALRNDFSGWVGLRFTVGSADILVSSLGRWVEAGNGRTHRVRLANATTGVDVPGATVTVDTNGAPAGAFRFSALAAPVRLPAGGSFYLMSEETAGGDVWHDWDTRLVTAPGAASTGGVYATAARPNDFIVGGGGGAAYVPPNFLYG